ncbi:MAG: porin, partial [Burkholderiales bacterium]
VLSYKFDTSLGTTMIGALWERLSYNNSDTTPVATTLEHYNRDAYYFPLMHKIGAGTIRASYGYARSGSCDRAATACSTNGLDARQYVFGGSYSFSKRTDVYALWSQTNNGQFAAYELGNANTAYNTGVPVGAKQTGIGLGIRHVF